jgi:hypothetical protein
VVLTVNLTVKFFSVFLFRNFTVKPIRGTRETPANNGAFATLDRRVWEIVERPVDGESRGRRSLQISNSELHGG